MINTIIVEDNTYIQNHFANMLSADERFYVLGCYRDALDGETACLRERADLVLMDVQTLHNHSGLASARRIREQCPRTKVIVVTSLIDPDILAEARRGGADSLWYKDHCDSDIMEVIELTLAGKNIFPDTSPAVEINEMLSTDISPRQIEILRRFVCGITYDEIAADLKLTKRGVRWNLDQIVEKGGFANKHELIAAVIESKLIVTTLK